MARQLKTKPARLILQRARRIRKALANTFRDDRIFDALETIERQARRLDRKASRALAAASDADVAWATDEVERMGADAAKEEPTP